MEEHIYGNIHSLETFGTVDGPGARFVVFLQGCPMRCRYCHNPDTWDFNINKKMTSEELLNKFDSIKEFLKNGGITLTGGEPLVQIDFAVDFFKKARAKNIHTALDTSGITFNLADTKKIDELLEYTNLVLLDIKHINNEEHIKLTNHSNKNVLDFAKYLSDKNIPVWIRHVVVPNITFNEEYLSQLGSFLAQLTNLKAIDILPYHNMAIPKYESMGIEYSLKDLQPLNKEDLQKAKNIIINSYKKNK